MTATPRPHRRNAGPVTVRFKQCGCGVLIAEECDCREHQNSARRLFERPLILRTWRPANAASPAKNGYR